MQKTRHQHSPAFHGKRHQNRRWSGRARQTDRANVQSALTSLLETGPDSFESSALPERLPRSRYRFAAYSANRDRGIAARLKAVQIARLNLLPLSSHSTTCSWVSG